jgi:hypothetical protein
MLPSVIQELLATLKEQGFAQRHPRPATELISEETPPFILERTRDGLADTFWIVLLEPDEWLVGSGFGPLVWPAGDVLRGSNGERPASPSPFGALADQVDAALRLADRFNIDHAARERAHALFSPKPDDPALQGLGDDPCWCGSGKKLKRCHRTLSASE